MPHVIIDQESKSLRERFAIIKTKRTNRQRYPEANVAVVESEQAAREGADSERGLYPAVVYGPSVSSESQRIYYLVRWL